MAGHLGASGGNVDGSVMTVGPVLLVALTASKLSKRATAAATAAASAPFAIAWRAQLETGAIINTCSAVIALSFLHFCC